MKLNEVQQLKENISFINKIIETIISREIKKAIHPLIKEITNLKESLILNQEYKFNQNTKIDKADNYPVNSNNNINANVFREQSDNSTLFSILSEITPFEDEDKVESILDNLDSNSEPNSIGMKMLSNVINENKLKKTLNHIMKS